MHISPFNAISSTITKPSKLKISLEKDLLELSKPRKELPLPEKKKIKIKSGLKELPSKTSHKLVLLSNNLVELEIRISVNSWMVCMSLTKDWLLTLNYDQNHFYVLKI